MGGRGEVRYAPLKTLQATYSRLIVLRKPGRLAVF